MAPTLEEATAAALVRLGVSTLHEAAGGIGALDVALRPVWREAAISGPAYPVACHTLDLLGLREDPEG